MAAITIKRGDSQTIEVTYVDRTGTALDLTGATVFFTVNASNTPDDDSQAVIEKTISSISSPELGIVTIDLANSDTQDIDPGTYYYDASVKDSLGHVTTSKIDKFVVTSDITRRTS